MDREEQELCVSTLFLFFLFPIVAIVRPRWSHGATPSAALQRTHTRIYTHTHTLRWRLLPRPTALLSPSLGSSLVQGTNRLLVCSYRIYRQAGRQAGSYRSCVCVCVRACFSLCHAAILSCCVPAAAVARGNKQPAPCTFRDKIFLLFCIFLSFLALFSGLLFSRGIGR